MSAWLDRQLRRVRSASSDYELEEVKKEMENHLPAGLINGSDSYKTVTNLTTTNDMGLSLGGGDEGTHLHLHLGGQGGASVPGMSQDQPPPPQNGPAPPNATGGGDVETRLAALEASVATLTQQLAEVTGGEGGEEQVELEDPMSKDSRSYIMRRSRKKVGDEELMVPVVKTDLMGQTDLPGIEDLNELPTAVGVVAVRKTGDSFDMEAVWQDAMAKAEIIVPGIRVPTFDGRVSQEVTTRRLCSFRRQTLDAALDNDNTKDVVTSLTDLKNHNQIRSLSCDSTRMAFNILASAIGGHRNDIMVRSVGDSATRQTTHKGTPSIAEMQRRNKEAWKTGEFKRPTT